MAINIEGICEILKNEIINLDLTPGTKICEEDLAKRFGISRTPVRSVISRLEKDGLLVVQAKRGTFVSKIDVGNITASLYIRKAVETSVIRNIIGKLDKDQINELQLILDRQKEIIAMEPSIQKSKMFFHNDNLFHATIFHFAGLDGVWKEIHTNQTNLNRVRIMANLRTTNKVEKVYDQHVRILEDLKSNNLDDCLEIFTNHIDGGFEGIEQVMTQYKDYFI